MFESGMDAATSDRANHAAHCDRPGKARGQLKPPCLPKPRLNDERKPGSCLVPNFIIVAGRHMKNIGTGTQIVIFLKPLGSSLHPFMIHVFEFVPKQDLLRSRKT